MLTCEEPIYSLWQPLLYARIDPNLHPSPKVMADFFRNKNQHGAFIQFAHFLVDLWNVMFTRCLNLVQISWSLASLLQNHSRKSVGHCVRLSSSPCMQN